MPGLCRRKAKADSGHVPRCPTAKQDIVQYSILPISINPTVLSGFSVSHWARRNIRLELAWKIGSCAWPPRAFSVPVFLQDSTSHRRHTSLEHAQAKVPIPSMVHSRTWPTREPCQILHITVGFTLSLLLHASAPVLTTFPLHGAKLGG